MKRYLLSLYTFTFVVMAYSQTVNILSVNSNIDNSTKSYLMSYIDSLTFDLDQQLQVLNIKGEKHLMPIDDVAYLSYEKSEVETFYFPEFLEGADTYMSTDGIVLSVEKDSISGYTIFVDSLDLKANQWIDDKALEIYCDPEGKPIIAVFSEGSILFQYHNDQTFSFTFTNGDGNMHSYSDLQITSSVRRFNSRTRASVDEDNLTIVSYCYAILELALKTIMNAEGVKVGVLSLVGNILIDFWGANRVIMNMDSSKIGSLAISILASIGAKSALGYVGVFIAYAQLISNIRDNVVKREIGDITPTIVSVTPENGRASVQIEFSGDGMSLDKRDIPYYHVCYWEEENGHRVGEKLYTSTKLVNDQSTLEQISGLSNGTYAFQVYVYPSTYENSIFSKFLTTVYSFHSNIARTNIVALAPTGGQKVDLGLSVKWAGWNVGASSPEEFGNFYAWGETSVKEMYSWDNYKFRGTASTMSCVSIPGGKLQGSQNDVAREEWGGKWRMPTQSEMEELETKCSSVWCAYNGIYGRLFYGPNGNSIFFPACGYYYGTDIIQSGVLGAYWTATDVSANYYNQTAYKLYFGSSSVLTNQADYRYMGLSVRAVSD